MLWCAALLPCSLELVYKSICCGSFPQYRRLFCNTIRFSRRWWWWWCLASPRIVGVKLQMILFFFCFTPATVSLCSLFNYFFLFSLAKCRMPFFLFATIDDGRNLFCRAIFDATSTINLRIWYWRIQLCRRMREFACCRFIDVIDGWQWPTFLFRTQPSHKSRSAVISLSCNVAAFARWRSATITNKMIYENVFGRRIFPGCHTRLYHILLQPTALLLCSVNLCGSCTAHFLSQFT